MRRLFKSAWSWLYDKVKAQILGYIFGGGLMLLVTQLLNSADTTDLSPNQRAVWSLVTALVLGLGNAIRRPETKVIAPGE